MKRIISILVFINLALLYQGSANANNNTPSNNIYSRISGTWGLEKPGALDCKQLPSQYEFKSNNKTMHITSEKKQPMYNGTTRDIVNYKVITSDNISVSLAMENDTRVDKYGMPVLWKLILVGDNKFYWEIGGDSNNRWGPLVRCKQ